MSSNLLLLVLWLTTFLIPALGICKNDVRRSNPLALFDFGGNAIGQATSCRHVRKAYSNLCSVTLGSRFLKEGQAPIGGVGGRCCRACCRNTLRKNPQIVEGKEFRSCKQLMMAFPVLMCEMFGAPGGVCCKRCHKVCTAGIKAQGSFAKSFVKYNHDVWPSLQNQISANGQLEIRNYAISMSIRTLMQQGIIFYAYSSKGSDFVAVFMKDGYIGCMLNVNGTTVVLTSSHNTYASGRWHELRISRTHADVKMCVDQDCVSSVVDDVDLTLDPYLYVGGIDLDDASLEQSAQNALAFTAGFVGCTAKLTIDGKSSTGIPSLQRNTAPCFLC